MSSSVNDTIIQLLNDITINMNRYLTIFIFLFGFIGNILNIFVLSQRNLRRNSCAWLFLISSIFNLMSIVVGLTTRILSGWYIDPTNTIDWLCQFRIFIVFSSRTNAFWLIMFATIDRWLLSSSKIHFRNLTTLKNVQRISLIFIIIICLIHIQVFHCYEANLPDTPLKCYTKSMICRQLNDGIYMSLTILFPLTLMLIFGILTILNIRKTKRRIGVDLNQPNIIITTQKQLLKKKMDRHLFKMLCVQIILLTILLLPQAIYKFYVTIRNNHTTIYDIAIENLVYNIVLLLAYIASGIPFYIYTLCGGEIFRKEFLNVFRIVHQ